MSTVLKVSPCPLAISTAVELLLKPKAGEVYLYTTGKDVSKKGTYTILVL